MRDLAELKRVNSGAKAKPQREGDKLGAYSGEPSALFAQHAWDRSTVAGFLDRMVGPSHVAGEAL